jgi:hypothetical protein
MTLRLNQTIAVVAVEEGVLQLGSTKKVWIFFFFFFFTFS